MEQNDRLPADRDQRFTVPLIATATVGLGVLLIDPARLPYLLIPGSFLLAASGAARAVERFSGPLCPSPSSERPLLHLATGLATGTAILALIAAIAALCGIYPVAGLVTGLLAIWTLIDCGRNVRMSRLTPIRGMDWLNGLVVGAVWLLVILWATIPPAFYDALAYHLPIPQYALSAGTSPTFPWSYFFFMPHASDLLLGWGMAFAGAIGAQAMHVTAWLTMCLCAWGLAESLDRSGQCHGIPAAITGALASSVTLLFLGTLPFAETSLTIAVVAAAALLLLPPTRSQPWLAVGLLWGFAASVKLSGASWILAEAVAALVMGWPWRSVGLASLVAVGASAPWWGRAWITTGNPIYPMGYRWLGGQYWGDEQQARLLGDLPSLGSPYDLWEILRLPYDMVITPDRFGSASDAGPFAVASLCIVLIIPIVMRLTQASAESRRMYDALAIFLGLVLASWMSTSTTTRFLAPALVLSLVVTTTLLLRLKRYARIAACAGILLLGIWGGTRFIAQHSLVFSSDQVALGRESPDSYAARYLDHYEAARYVREQLPVDARLLFIGETRPFYFDRPSIAPYPFHDHPLTQWVKDAASPEALKDRLRAEGLTHVILNIREFRRVHTTYHVLKFDGPEAEVLDHRLKDLSRVLTPLFSKNGVFVFAVPPPSQASVERPQGSSPLPRRPSDGGFAQSQPPR